MRIINYILMVIFLGMACESGLNENKTSTPNFTQTKQIIEKKMKEQETSWNAGDIDGFMKPYWQNSELSFVGKRGITKGYNQVLNNYKETYPDKEAMGTLAFDNVKYIDCGKELTHLTGKWTLFRKQDTLSGYYSLVWKLILDDWKIIYDHSS